MTSELIAVLPIYYVAFLLSTVVHEAAHALVAKWGGDLTAYAGGQVSLDPLPHIKREPFGLVLMPLLSLMTSNSMFGWGSAPFDPYWQIRYPRRSALMALAGPVSNFMLVGVVAVVMHIGIAAGVFVPISNLGVTSLHGGLLEGLGFFLSVMLRLNILLGVFNLLPVPPLDGHAVLGLFLPESTFLRFLEWVRSPMASLIGFLIALQVLPYLVGPAFMFAGHLINLM
ncbi:MAG: site-2 protease family protein [Pseudomonadota bacterium]|jgi:Zn-dependent protease